MNPEPLPELEDCGARLVCGDQLIVLPGSQPALDLASGLRRRPCGTRWDYFEELAETFSLVTEVRVTSQEVHHVVKKTTFAQFSGRIACPIARPVARRILSIT